MRYEKGGKESRKEEQTAFLRKVNEPKTSFCYWKGTVLLAVVQLYFHLHYLASMSCSEKNLILIMIKEVVLQQFFVCFHAGAD